MSEISCEEVLREIEHYLHGELDPISSARLAVHLETCTPCLDRAEFQRKLKEIVRSKCYSEAPDHVIVRIRHALQLERESRNQAQPP